MYICIYIYIYMYFSGFCGDFFGASGCRAVLRGWRVHAAEEIALDESQHEARGGMCKGLGLGFRV